MGVYTMPTIADIRVLTRRLTKSLSPTQVTDAEIDTFIDSYVLYEFPESIRTFNLRKQFTFYTNPYVSAYTTGSSAELADFKNINLTVHPPFYIGGKRASYFQSTDLFYGMYPDSVFQETITTGDGVTVNFVGTLANKPLVPGKVLFSSIRFDNTGLKLYDNGSGILSGDGLGTIDYVTGAYTLNFDFAPGVGKSLIAQISPYTPALPTAILFFQDTFYLRPIPDQVYAVSFEVNQRPSQIPELDEWWELIAYGASRKLLLSRGLTDELAKIEPEFNRLTLLAERRTIAQNDTQRTATLFTTPGVDYRNPFRM